MSICIQKCLLWATAAIVTLIHLICSTGDSTFSLNVYPPIYSVPHFFEASFRKKGKRTQACFLNSVWTYNCLVMFCGDTPLREGSEKIISNLWSLSFPLVNSIASAIQITRQRVSTTKEAGLHPETTSLSTWLALLNQAQMLCERECECACMRWEVQRHIHTANVYPTNYLTVANWLRKTRVKNEHSRGVGDWTHLVQYVPCSSHLLI